MPDPSVAYLGLGTNEGDRRHNLTAALAALAGIAQVEAVSRVYESEPVGVTDQPHFWNMVARVRTTLLPSELLAKLQHIERELGRRETVRWGPRPIDIDILLYGDSTYDSEVLEIPHPRMMERAFVLRPLSELDATLRHPRTGTPLVQADPAGEARPLFPGEELLGGAKLP